LELSPEHQNLRDILQIEDAAYSAAARVYEATPSPNCCRTYWSVSIAARNAFDKRHAAFEECIKAGFNPYE
jgi:hypothetical protein